MGLKKATLQDKKKRPSLQYQSLLIGLLENLVGEEISSVY